MCTLPLDDENRVSRTGASIVPHRVAIWQQALYAQTCFFLRYRHRSRGRGAVFAPHALNKQCRRRRRRRSASFGLVIVSLVRIESI